MGQDHGELLATVTGSHVIGTGSAGDEGGELLQHPVAGRVPEGVVDALELIEVEKHQRQRDGVALGALPFLRQLSLEGAEVVQTRLVVDHQSLFEMLVLVRQVLDGRLEADQLLTGTEQALDPQVDFLEDERLAQVVVGACAEGLHLGVQVPTRRQHHDRDSAGAGVFLELLRDGDAVDPRHLQVEQNDVRVLLGGDFDSALTVGRFQDLERTRVEPLAGEPSRVRLVVDDEDAVLHAFGNRLLQVSPSAF